MQSARGQHTKAHSLWHIPTELVEERRMQQERRDTERRILQLKLHPSHAGSNRRAPLPPTPRRIGLDKAEIAAADEALLQAIGDAQEALEMTRRKQNTLRDFQCLEPLREALMRANAARISPRMALAFGVDGQVVRDGAARLRDIEAAKRRHVHEVEEAEALLHAALNASSNTDSDEYLRSVMPKAMPLKKFIAKDLFERATSRMMQKAKQDVTRKLRVLSAFGGPPTRDDTTRG